MPTREAGLVEPLGRVLADRLQHREALAGVAEEALVDERLQHVEVCVCDFLCRVERAAPCEDRKSSEELLLLRRQEVVRPLDRRPQRLLAGFGIAASLQQVEAPGQALEELLG